MIFDTGNRILAGAAIVFLVIAVNSQAVQDSKSSITDPLAEPDPATLGSMDEQYAWVGDLGDRDALPGKQLYTKNCAGCHEAQVYKAPHTTWLELMSPPVLYRAITQGIMQAQAAHLPDSDKRHIVEYITQMRLGDPDAGPEVAWCEGPASEFTELDERQLSGWGHDTRRYVSPEAAGFNRSQIGDLKLKWSFGFPASTRARSQPTIAMNAVFVGSQDGTVYAFDLDTGCVRWTFAARAEVRTGITLGKRGPEGIPTAYFGDIIANLYAIDANTGDLLLGWDTDQFPTDIYLTTKSMLAILKHGGIAPGGVNFDAKVRRESHEPIDLFHAHIGGMDAFARGLKIAAAIRADGRLEEAVNDRYDSWNHGVGKDIENGTANFESLESYMLNKGEISDNKSGRQEYLENLINEYI